jgi:hypothetical protein
LVGIESTLADLRQDLAGLRRDREKLAARSEYFSSCYNEFEKTGKRGEELFLLLKSTKDEVFKNKDLGKDEVREVFNTLSIDLQTFDLNFFINCRFISGPTIPEMHIKPRIGLIVIASCFSSFFVLIFLAFILQWLQNNRERLPH